MSIKFACLPKAELHVHIEGTIPAETIWKIAMRHKVALPVNSLAGLKNILTTDYAGFNNFRNLWLLIISCLRDDHDYKQITRDFLERCQIEKIVYAEVHFTPYSHYCAGIDGFKVLQCILDTLDTLSAQFNTDVRIIIDIPRSRQGNTAANYTLEILEKSNHSRLIGIGLSGFEPGNPAQRFEYHFQRAAKLGYRRVAHAGETDGAESVRQAIEILGAERIGHGVRVIENEKVFRQVLSQKIPLEICLTSNVKTGVFSKNSHPIKNLYSNLCEITINSDDPTFFNTTLSQEYQIASETYGFSHRDIFKIACNGIHHSFMSSYEKKKLLKIFEIEWGFSGDTDTFGGTLCHF